MLSHKHLALSWAAVPLCTTANQACMKLLAINLGDQPFGLAWLEIALKTPYIIGILFFEIVSFILWIRILAVMDVGRAVPITAIAYIFVLALGWFGFNEPMHEIQIIGSTLILVGVFLLSTTDRPSTGTIK